MSSLVRGRGPLTLTDFYHSANEIAALLVLIGQGVSLRKASQTVRYDAQRYISDGTGFRFASREHNLAARYLDRFGPLLDAHLAQTRWPLIVVLDSIPLSIKAYDAPDFGYEWNESARAGGILVAVGSDSPERMKAWRFGLAGDDSATSWLAFLNEMDGDPEWVVADGSKAIKRAVAERWPRATFISCEWHLQRALLSAAVPDGWHEGLGEWTRVMKEAVWNKQGWDDLRSFAEAKNATSMSPFARSHVPRGCRVCRRQHWKKHEKKLPPTVATTDSMFGRQSTSAVAGWVTLPRYGGLGHAVRLGPQGSGRARRGLTGCL